MGSVVSVAVAVAGTKEELTRSLQLYTESNDGENTEQDRPSGNSAAGEPTYARGAGSSRLLSTTMPTSSRCGVGEGNDTLSPCKTSDVDGSAEPREDRADGTDGAAPDIAHSRVAVDQKGSGEVGGERQPFLAAGAKGAAAGHGIRDEGEDKAIAMDGPRKLSLASEQVSPFPLRGPSGAGTTTATMTALQPQRPNGLRSSRLQEGRSRMFSLGRNGFQEAADDVVSEEDIVAADIVSAGGGPEP